MQDDICRSIIEENERRLERLRAEYDPVTGEGVAELTGLKRVKLKISDFAIPVQWVPPEMLENKMIKHLRRNPLDRDGEV